MDIAIFGGSFNPVHMGHYEIVCFLIQQRGFKRVIVVPAFQNPLKCGPPAIPELTRRLMLQTTFKEWAEVEISSFEIENREISFTYKTLTHFKRIYADDSLFLVLGEDSFTSFPKWYRIDTIVTLASILVFPRTEQRSPGSVVPFDHGFENEVEWLDCRIPNISSTEIRNSNLATIENNHWLHPEALNQWKAYCHINQ